MRANRPTPERQPRTPSEVQSLLEGPVNSIPTPFLSDGAIDREGVRNIIETGIGGGSRVSLLTYGDSQFDLLSDEEVAELTRLLVEQVRGRALTVAATRRWWTGRAVEFARFCRELGVDVLMVLPPDQAPPRGRVEHYRAIAAVMPVMLVGAPGDEILDALLEDPNVCCFKEDGTLDYALRALRRYGHRWRFMTGGRLTRHYPQWVYGCRAFMCCYSSFAPHVARRYWDAIQAGDEATVREILTAIDGPFFDLHATVGGGIQAVWRAALELNGIAARHLRPPMLTAADAEVEQLRDCLSALGLLRR